ncbi:DUF4760 domain-containing protein [Thiomicrorhabdus sp.]|uniref:DUF4760 domain-containing protein n=1 Tax=Thiomicrorhabdus sp. TaxID=2039724 RepID=UPI0029C94703|nr:DUF4760 domain-containing protein [Thiomicrorhabdus sp.]
MDYYWINGLATLFVGGSAMYMAHRAIKSNKDTAEKAKTESRKLAKQQLTTTILLNMHENQIVLDKFTIMRNLHNQSGNGLVELAKKNLNDEEREKSKTIIEVLSFFETISAGVRHDIYDLQIIKDNMQSAIKHLWQISEPYIHRKRTDDNNPKYYEHLEWLKNQL